KSMSLFMLDLNRSARSICIGSQSVERFVQPIRRRAAQQIVAPPQIQIAQEVRASRAARALCGFSERDFPGVFEIVHAVCSIAFSSVVDSNTKAKAYAYFSFDLALMLSCPPNQTLRQRVNF